MINPAIPGGATSLRRLRPVANGLARFDTDTLVRPRTAAVGTPRALPPRWARKLGGDAANLVLRWLAQGYALNGRPDLESAFDTAGELHSELVSGASTAAIQAAVRAVSDAFDYLELVARGCTPPATARGHRYVMRARCQGARYVIFSDHHVTPAGHLQDFFVRSRNSALYAEVLATYCRTSDYVVVENGDVEELVIFDPGEHPHQHERLREVTGDWEQLRQRRLVVRKQQLHRILNDGALAPWREVSKMLAQQRRLVRIAGNHDFDLQQAELYPLFERALGYREDCVFDYLCLQDEPALARYVIAHGHQYDQVSNPTAGRRFGETMSETRGVWFQGADRHWGWESDGPRAWLAGDQPLRNLLATDLPGNRRDENLPAPPYPELLELQRDLWLQGLFEKWLFGRNLAWEYFDERSALRAFWREVVPGKRFAKFRHMNEERIRHELSTRFPDATRRPTLVLGHSHEARFQAFSAYGDEPCDFYLNTGAAGRYENLIWAVEIDDGVARLVSWSRPDGPHGGALPTRHVWTPRGTTTLAAGPPASIPAPGGAP